MIPHLIPCTEGSKRVFSVIDFGAQGDGQHDDTKVYYMYAIAMSSSNIQLH